MSTHKFQGKRPLKLYDVYQGNKYIMTGNILEISKKLNLTPHSVTNYINADQKDQPYAKYLIFPIEGSNKVIYAMYRGDKLLDVGTKDELADKFNVKSTTIEHYSTPAYHRKINKAHRMYAIRLSTQDIEELHKFNSKEDKHAK